MGKKSKGEQAVLVPAVALLEEDGTASRAFKQCLVKLFGRFDVDGDGVLSRSEMQAFSAAANEGAEPFGDEQLSQISSAFDWKEKADGKEAGLTLRGFIDMCVTKAKTREEDAWNDIRRLGYNDQLAEQTATSEKKVTTRIDALQARLDEFVSLGEQGQLKEFVSAFCAPDIDDDDKEHFLKTLNGDGGEEPLLPSLLPELRCCASGSNVFKIEGDKKQNSKGPVVFHFHSPAPGAERIDREVSFVKIGEQWYAEG